MDGIPDIVDVVLWFLGVLSVLIWSIGLAKFVSFKLGRRDNKNFLVKFNQARHFQELHSSVEDTGPLARMCIAGQREVDSWRHSPQAIDEERKLDILQQALHAQAYIEQVRMENWLSVLASVGSTAPFIGLFGTVWGIMHALKGISLSGSAGLDVVAGPIGEALIATAIGIATAVPSVLAYNYFVRQVKINIGELENFSSAFQSALIKSGIL
jgi:biopolymer transport protein ExbB